MFNFDKIARVVVKGGCVTIVEGGKELFEMYFVGIIG